ncbi:hypothetical protein C8R45DRAFT_533023 [Mycena sanguinolenta]|nr:hypothetical protein C8R45DRAFT_533023 [Mycena sanguinolenta]
MAPQDLGWCSTSRNCLSPQSNRLVCLGLVERSAIILHAILEEVQEVGDGLLDPPIDKLLGTLKEIAEMFPKLGNRSFLKRYMKRAEALREIARCDSILRDALAISSPSFQKRVLRDIQQMQELINTPGDVPAQTQKHANNPRSGNDGEDSNALNPLPSTMSQMKASVLRAITQRATLENKIDSVQDAADVSSVLSRALTQDSEVELLRILELDRDEVPETMMLLQRAVDDAEVPPAYSPGAGPPEYAPNNTVDPKLIIGVIDALRRVEALDSHVPTTPQFPRIYLPPGAGPNRRLIRPVNGIPFRSTDAVALNRELTAGGTVLSVCAVPDAVAWIEAHYDDSLLSAIRAHNFNGPLAIPLSPVESALAIFGPVADALIPQMAKELAQLSNFAVIVRPSEDNPIPNFLPAVDTAPVSGEATVGKVSRLRGGAGEDDLDSHATPQWEGEFHNETIDLRLKLNNERVYDVNLSSFIKFKTQPMSNPGGARPHPEVLSFVALKVNLRREETQLDRSFSNIGLLAHRSNSISNYEFLDVGYEPPDVVLQRNEGSSTSGNIGMNFGLTGVVPGFGVSGSYGWGGNVGLQSANNKPIPKCNVRHDPGRTWDPEEAQNADQDFRSYDVAWFPETDPEKVAYEMRVEFGLGINIRRNKLFGARMPPISSIVRNQIVIWVKDPGLRSQGRGVMLLTSTYIPNALTDGCLTISSRVTANLNAASAPNVPVGEALDIPDGMLVSTAVAPLDKAKKKKKPSKITRLIHKLPFKSSAPAGLSSEQQLPMYETVSRGWDTANMRWRDVLWPTLDDQFRIIDSKSSEPAAWKLEWDTKGATLSTDSSPANSTVPIIMVPGSPQLTPLSASTIPLPSLGASNSSTTLPPSPVSDVGEGGPEK